MAKNDYIVKLFIEKKAAALAAFSELFPESAS